MWWNGLARAVMLTAAMLAVSAAVPAETAHAPASRPLYTTQAPIVMLKDMDSGAILFERGAGKCFAPASMAMVMTAYVVLDLIDSGKMSRDNMVPYSRATCENWKCCSRGSTKFHRAGSRVSVDDLLKELIDRKGTRLYSNHQCATRMPI